jgi:putative endonuclease
MASTGWFCYLLECADGTLYAGITTAVERRLIAHNLGSASKYTRARRPVRLVHIEPWPDRSSATRRELVLKKLSRAAKLQMLRGDGPRRGLRVLGQPPLRRRRQRVAIGGR